MSMKASETTSPLEGEIAEIASIHDVSAPVFQVNDRTEIQNLMRSYNQCRQHRATLLSLVRSRSGVKDAAPAPVLTAYEQQRHVIIHRLAAKYSIERMMLSNILYDYDRLTKQGPAQGLTPEMHAKCLRLIEQRIEHAKWGAVPKDIQTAADVAMALIGLAAPQPEEKV